LKGYRKGQQQLNKAVNSTTKESQKSLPKLRNQRNENALGIEEVVLTLAEFQRQGSRRREIIHQFIDVGLWAYFPCFFLQQLPARVFPSQAFLSVNRFYWRFP